MKRTMVIAALACLGCAGADEPSAGSDGAVPDCTPRSDASVMGDYPTSEALPTGACVASESCRITVRDPCPYPGVLGPANGYACSCDAGHWACAIVEHGGGACIPSNPDASD